MKNPKAKKPKGNLERPVWLNLVDLPFSFLN